MGDNTGDLQLTFIQENGTERSAQLITLQNKKVIVYFIIKNGITRTFLVDHDDIDLIDSKKWYITNNEFVAYDNTVDDITTTYYLYELVAHKHNISEPDIPIPIDFVNNITTDCRMANLALPKWKN
ncbi:MAG: hypothetical protein Faunusvirus8_38 [Faunusvirus sp.]|jgi:hypothetical protein|uniref:Uncharacterized protein n=1 Tax=Faunusvirus sp. TaxID=2487766 RepID=A0A3G4ZZ85_9VIRU|nr:MAG: hypothetical protein Faunusvirus8_38 [Faunusvirus sp.]